MRSQKMKSMLFFLAYTIIFYKILYYLISICNKYAVKEKKNLLNYKILLKWIRLKQAHVSLSEFLNENGYHRIAIYGMGEIGIVLTTELKNEGVDIVFAIDRNPIDVKINWIKLVKPDQIAPDKIDAIIVSLPWEFEDIKNILSLKYQCPILSIEDIIERLLVNTPLYFTTF